MSVQQGGGRYQLTSRIATGGMGEVWLAEDTVLDREVAVKVLKHEYADDPVFRARFEAEARNAAALVHPNAAAVFDVGEISGDQDGSGTRRPFLVMELVPGQPLSALLRGGEAMPPDRAADVVAQAADAIAAAHAIGIVHRDVKPANLLVTPDGTVKITDFGIARAGDGAAITQTGQIVGTPHYISPEQAEGHPATGASDIYALGVVLYECLAGRRPFLKDTPIQVALAHIREEAPPLGEEVPPRMRAIVGKALAKDPAERFASAADLASALRGGDVPGLLISHADQGRQATPVGPAATQVLATPSAGAPDTEGTPAPSGHRRAERRTWWPWLLAAAAVAVIVLATAAFAGDDGGEGAPDPVAPATSAAPSQRTSDEVRVNEADYVGRELAAVRAELEDLGLRVEPERVAATSPDQDEGTVASVRPDGQLDPGSTVTVQVWEAYVEPAPEEPGQGEQDSGDDKPGKGDDKGKAKGKKD